MNYREWKGTPRRKFRVHPGLDDLEMVEWKQDLHRIRRNPDRMKAHKVA